MIRVDGSVHRKLTDGVAGPFSIDGWSADGRIVFSNSEGGASDIYIINPTARDGRV